MRPFLIISILSILAFNHIGYYFVLQFQQEKIKECMKEKIIAAVGNDELAAINYTDNTKEISWEDDDASEFSYHGKMYDVVRQSEVNGKTILHCIADDKETQVVQKYTDSFKGHDGIEKKQKKNAGQTTVLYCAAFPASRIFYPAFPVVNQGNDDGSLASGNNNKKSPPPKA